MLLIESFDIGWYTEASDSYEFIYILFDTPQTVIDGLTVLFRRKETQSVL